MNGNIVAIMFAVIVTETRNFRMTTPASSRHKMKVKEQTFSIQEGIRVNKHATTMQQ